MKKEWKTYFITLGISLLPFLCGLGMAIYIIASYKSTDPSDNGAGFALLIPVFIGIYYAIAGTICLIVACFVKDKSWKYALFGAMTAGLLPAFCVITYGLGLIIVPVVLTIIYKKQKK